LSGGALGEFGLIDRLLKPLAAGYPGALGLTDDAALVRVPAGEELVVAKDAIVAGVHFLEDDPAELVAGKLLRTNLSDLAAMGALPLGYLTALARPPGLAEDWLRRFARGLAADQARFGCHLLGGDTVSTPGPLVLSLTILGTVPEGRALRRSGARPGDRVWVSGTLGDAALGLRALRGLALPEDETLQLTDRYRTPQPRLGLGRALLGTATAAMDVSDGLVADLAHIAAASGAAAVVEADALPLSPAGRGVPGALEAALAGGDDYELLFTAPPEADGRLRALAGELGLPLTPVGRVEAGSGVRVLDASGAELRLDQTGWRHF
jgi:thiamine-monophosphate kinase